MHPFFETYQTNRKPILFSSPELLFICALCDSDVDKAVSLFDTKVQFENQTPVVDAPHGRYEGLEKIRTFAEGWLDSFSADSASVLPVIQTRSGGRSVTEFVASFFNQDKLLWEIPMLIVAEIRADGKMDGARIYFHFKQAPGFSAYRAPIFHSQHMTEQEPHLLTGSVRAYLEALHTQPRCDVERVMEIVGEECCFGGYVPDQPIIRCLREELRAAYEHMSTYIPRWLRIRFETVIDDGITCVIEWVHIITKEGREEGGRLCESGVAAYERGTDGRLSGIRICDYAHCESMIDWNKTGITKEEAEKINYLG